MNHFFLPRRLLAVVFSALLGIVAFSAIAAGPAAAAGPPKRYIHFQPKSVMNILDDESWPFADEKSSMNLTYQSGNFVWSGRLVDGPKLVASDCAGDEVRSELYLRSELSTIYKDWVWVTATARMFEGDDCFANGIDDEESISFWVGPEQTVSRNLLLVNPNGGDKAAIDLNLKNEYFVNPYG
jgi:hypothetical protein